MKNQIYNFGAGPAMLPEAILKEAQEEFLNWHDTGVSILELGHRTQDFMELLHQAEQSLRTILAIPNNYQILFLGGATRTQFAAIPMNILHAEEQGGYIVNGIWSQMAFEEAQRLKKAYCIISTEDKGYFSVPKFQNLDIRQNTRYIHYTPNETINGLRFPYIPKNQGLPLIADMTSCLLSEPIDINKYALIYAGAQKNIANAGLTVLIIRDDLLERAPEPAIPSMLDFKTQVANASLYATPPVFNCYLAAKMFDWIKSQGGIEVLFGQNCLKAAKLYQYLDSSEFYTTKVDPESRSLMNVCFDLRRTNLASSFLQEATEAGLYALNGHRLIGGFRASLYNAMPLSGVDALINFMQSFARKHD